MESRDLNFAAFLIAHGEKLAEAIPDENYRFWFIFDDSRQTADLSNEYYLGSASVNAQQFVIAQKKLKSLVRNFNPNNIKYDTSLYSKRN